MCVRLTLTLDDSVTNTHMLRQEIENHQTTSEIIRNALSEDLGKNGDITSLLTLSPDSVSVGDFLVKAEGVIAGLEIARLTFELLDPEIQFEILAADGTQVTVDQVVAEVSGRTKSLLSGERVALNFLQRMSGIATLTRQFVKAVSPYSTIILDTRKTAPGLRTLDKLAVKLGGGQNHRHNLSDAILVKDNHIAAVGTVSQTLARIFAGNSLNLPVEVEVKNLNELSEALTFPVDRILLDNMSLDQMREAVGIVAGRVPLEASGNVNLSRVKDIAATGVSHISIGALTHSVKALDISLEIHDQN